MATRNGQDREDGKMASANISSRRPLWGAALVGLTLLVATTSTMSNTSNSSNTTESAASWSDALGLNDLLDYYYYYHQAGRRRLHHPHGEIKKYLMCTRLLAKSDGNYDNSLTMDEFRDFSNQLADESMGVTLGADGDGTLPAELQKVFVDYATKTEGRSKQIIDIYGSRNGERNGITAHQEQLLEDLCNETSVILDGLFSEEAKMLGQTAMTESTMREVDHHDVSIKGLIMCLWSTAP